MIGILDQRFSPTCFDAMRGVWLGRSYVLSHRRMGRACGRDPNSGIEMENAGSVVCARGTIQIMRKQS